MQFSMNLSLTVFAHNKTVNYIPSHEYISMVVLPLSKAAPVGTAIVAIEKAVSGLIHSACIGPVMVV